MCIFRHRWVQLMLLLSFSLDSRLLVQSASGQIKNWSADGMRWSEENTRRVGSLTLDNGAAAGSCFYVDERGYVATCFSNVRDCKDAFVHFDRNTRLRVLGIVAASRSRDIAILKLNDIPKDDQRFSKSLELRSDAALPLGEELVAWGGPFAVPAAAAKYLPTVVRILDGDEYCQGLRGLTSDTLGFQPDNRWLWLSQSRHSSCNGGPVFNRAGHVVAMLSAGPNRQSPIFSAIKVQHVIDLLPKNDPKPKPLKLAKTWVDPLPNLDVLSPTTQNTSNADEADVSAHEASLGGLLQRSWPLAERFSALLQRSERASLEKSKIEQSIAAGQEDHLEVLSEAEKIRTEVAAEIASVRPEEPYQATETELEPHTRTVTVKVRDRDGKEKEEEKKVTEMRRVTKRVTKYRHSARQQQQIAIIRERLVPIEAKVKANEMRQISLNFDANISLPFVNQVVDQIEQEFFFLADPLGLRPVAEHEALEAELTRIIDAGGAQASIYLARGMSRIRLGDFQGATADLLESNDIGTEFHPLTRALQARIVGLQGERNKATIAVKSLLKEHDSNPRLLTIAARIEMDAGAAASAVRYLNQAHELLPSEVELKIGIAWVVSAGSGAPSKLALDVATSAVEWTGYRDWNAMAALANVHAMLKRVDLANQEIETAVKLAPPSAVDLCEGWRAELTAGKLVKRDWK